MPHAGLPSRHHSKPRTLSSPKAAPPRAYCMRMPCGMPGQPLLGSPRRRHNPYLHSPYKSQDAPMYLESRLPQHMLLPAHHTGAHTPMPPQSHMILVHPALWSRPACTGWPCPMPAQQATIARYSWVRPTQGIMHAACPMAFQPSQSWGALGGAMHGHCQGRAAWDTLVTSPCARHHELANARAPQKTGCPVGF